jgi:ribosomal protein S18 acetylase RimI-like enzyme
LKDKPMTLKIIVREATIDDLGDLTRLNEIFNEVKGTPEQFAERLADSKCVEIPIVAVDGNQVVGFAGLRVVPTVFYEEAHAELTEIFVEKPFQRRGVGQALISFAEGLAQDKGAGEIVLQTGMDNMEAIEFYSAQGYENWAITMGKTLSYK